MDPSVRRTKHYRVSSLRTLVVLCVVSGAFCDISIQNNGYRGIVVAISPRLREDDVPNLCQSLERVLNAASKFVFAELDHRAFFEEVTLLVPKTLKLQNVVNESGPGVKVEVSSRPHFASAHFTIEPEGVFGSTPYTLQFGPCGCRGLRTVLPASYVVSGEGEPLGREWLRLRYGVFSTGSFQGDPLYPEGVPSKQDVLCRSTVRDTVLRSQDFRGANLSGESSWKPVTLRVVGEAPLRLVVLWNIGKTTRNVSEEQKRTKNALKKFATTMAPVDSKIGVVYFGEDILDGDDQLLSMKNEDERKRVASFFPTVPKGNATFFDALKKAKDMLAQTDEVTSPLVGGTVLLVTAQTNPSEDYAQIEEFIQSAKITLHLLTIPQYAGDAALERLVSNSGGKIFNSANADLALSLSAQADAVYSMVLQGSSDSEKPNLVALTTEVWNDMHAGEKELAVDLDVKHADTLRVGITKRTADTAFDNSITLVSPDTGKTFTSKTLSEISDFFLREFVVSNPSPGRWTLKIDPPDNVQEPVVVDVKAKVGGLEDIITVSVWISQSYVDVDPLKPLLIYAEVRKGDRPIRGAEVNATVKTPRDEDVKFKLVDNGRGDPDVTMGDGIYSRYFTGFSDKGSYDLTVTVNAASDALAVGTRSVGEFLCCGSEFPTTPSEPTGLFARYTRYGSFVTSRDRPPGDIFPPSRVTDLRVTDVDHYSMRVTLEWTAPGNDFDSGAADFYEIRYFTKEVDFVAEFETAGTVIDSFNIDGLGAPPKKYGQPEKAVVFNMNCQREPDKCYLALRANDRRNKGDISNVVSVQFKQKPSQPGGTVTGDPAAGGGGHGSGHGTDTDYVENSRGGPLWGLIIGVPVALLFIIIVAIVLFLLIRRRRRSAPPSRQPSKRLQNGDGPVQNGDAAPHVPSKSPSSVWSTSISPVNSYSADYLLERYEEEQRRKNHKPSASAPDKEELPPSFEEPSVDKAHDNPLWWKPQERQVEDDVSGENEAQRQQIPVYASVDLQAKRKSPGRSHTAV